MAEEHRPNGHVHKYTLKNSWFTSKKLPYNLPIAIQPGREKHIDFIGLEIAQVGHVPKVSTVGPTRTAQ